MHVLEDVCGVLCEELRNAIPSKNVPGLDGYPSGYGALLRAQHERDIAACMKALAECELVFDPAKFLELCRDPVVHELEPRSK